MKMGIDNTDHPLATSSDSDRNLPKPAGTPDLDGMTILRFVRGYASGAGLEYDVAMINRALCERHSLHVLQIHLARPGDALEIVEERLGRGKVTRIPLLCDIVPVGEPKRQRHHAMRLLTWCRNAIRDHVLFSRLVEPWVLDVARVRRPQPRKGDVIGVGAKMCELLNMYRVDLIMIHAAGGSDVWEVINEARRAKIPAAIQLHFANERFKNFSVRVQAVRVAGVSGVSDIAVPSYLAGRFVSLFTGLDTAFYCRDRAGDFGRRFNHPVLFLPARIVPTKGHDDLIKIVLILRQLGTAADVVFAGRADQPEYENSLRRRIAAMGLKDCFHFAGMLNQEQLRNMYGVCTVVTFPTYHQEGLPRVLLEALSMNVPVVVYDSGGSQAGMIAGRTGFLIRKGDIEGFAVAVNRLLREPALAATMGSAGRRFVEERFSLEALARRHEEFYHHVILSQRAVG
jgi:glycosyltransferase involved in cell wall biosynthesis